MWFEADEIVELFRGYVPYYLLIALPIFIIISPINPVGASHEFPVYRMQQYDLHGVAHGKSEYLRIKNAIDNHLVIKEFAWNFDVIHSSLVLLGVT
jgi:hypothetical protein